MKKDLSQLKEFLDQKVELYNQPAFILNDPVSVPHQYKKLQDIEITAFWTAILAWGQRKTIINKAITLFQLPSLDKSLVDVLIKLNKKHKKPLIVCTTGSSYTQRIIKQLEINGVPVYPTPERAVNAFATMWRFSQLK